MATGTTKSAFSLLELVLVIAILILAASSLVPFLSDAIEREALNRTAREFEQMARSARLEAVTSGQPTAMLLDKNAISFRLPDANQEAASAQVKLPKTLSYEVRWWNAEKWTTPEKQRWTFQPSGLVEPMQIRFRQGTAWIELAFGPLTAETVSEKYYFP